MTRYQAIEEALQVIAHCYDIAGHVPLSAIEQAKTALALPEDEPMTVDIPALAADIVDNIRDGENIADAVRRDDIAETIAILHAAIQGRGK